MLIYIVFYLYIKTTKNANRKFRFAFVAESTLSNSNFKVYVGDGWIKIAILI